MKNPYYLKNKYIVPLLLKDIENDRVSEELGKVFLLLVDRFANRYNVRGYTYIDDMKSKALEFLLLYHKTFDYNKSKNAFSYLSQIVHNAFKQYIKNEKKEASYKVINYNGNLETQTQWDILQLQRNFTRTKNKKIIREYNEW